MINRPREWLARQALIHVTPAPTTLRESMAILSHLQRFGLISTLLNPRYVPALSKARDESPSSTLLAVYESSASLDSALAESPITVSTPVEPDPKEVDPFNIRGYHMRKRFPQRTFKCEIVRDEDPTRHSRLSKANKFHGGFKFGAGQKGGLVDDMRGQGLGKDLIGIAGVLPKNNLEAEIGSGGVVEMKKLPSIVRLMKTWRWAQQKLERKSTAARGLD